MASADLGSTEWERSKISPQDINLLKKLGISKKPDALRFPSEESYPTPPMEYRVSFVDHLIRGLSAPIHNFLRGLLFMYGLQLHHLTPNSILHISIFITLCESFLGVQPNWALWKRLFFCRHNPNVAYNIGGVVICVRPDVDYFDVKFPDSVQGWRKKWLYIHEENHGSVEDNIPPFDGAEKIHRRRSWDAEASAEEKAATEALMTRIHELQNTRGQELSGIQITAYFLRIRVQLSRLAKIPSGSMLAMKMRIVDKGLVKDLEKLVRKISSSKKKIQSLDLPRGADSATNPLPENHPELVSLPPFLKVEKSKNRPLSPTTTVVLRPESGRGSQIASPKKKLNLTPAFRRHPFPLLFPRETKGKGLKLSHRHSKAAEEVGPTEGGTTLNPYEAALISSDEEGDNPAIDVTARTSTSRTLVVSEAQPDGDETSTPQQADLAKPTNVLDALALKLEQSEKARKKVESAALLKIFTKTSQRKLE
ncbi:hypothetical protein QYE76_038754 [Lolium multiflorum]|uniref:Transposase (putative) gypsy type domain-containing protein n=1 Tax=Lolium multiflorum TaxID=4521 RepID=A0AAD8TA72_LOLMU|nr:hypothetical protein QYE76_038754 [Lolium multiflorum]